MKFKEMFGTKKVPQEEPQSNDVAENLSDESAAENAASEMLRELFSLEKAGKLSRPVEDYVGDGVFRDLLFSYGAEPAVIIYDLQNELAKAKEKAREEAQAQMQRMRRMPKPIRGSSPVEQETDFSKLTTEEFENLKKRIARGK